VIGVVAPSGGAGWGGRPEVGSGFGSEGGVFSDVSFSIDSFIMSMSKQQIYKAAIRENVAVWFNVQIKVQHT
jgi:hypothetical protein